LSLRTSSHILILTLILLCLPTIRAQEPTPSPTTADTIPVTPTPAISYQTVTITAADGQRLVGDFYYVEATNPTILMLHQLYTDRVSWSSYAALFQSSNVNALVVDLRGHGATAGDIDWGKAVDDVHLWLEWLRTEGGVNPLKITVMGSSIGANLAVAGCGVDAGCQGAIAISPGWNYYGVNIADGLTTQPTLIIYAERDRWPALGMPRIRAASDDGTHIVAYPGNAHGMNLLVDEMPDALPIIAGWIIQPIP